MRGGEISAYRIRDSLLRTRLQSIAPGRDLGLETADRIYSERMFYHPWTAGDKESTHPSGNEPDLIPNRFVP